METTMFGKNWEFRNHLELVKEQGLGRKDSTQQEAGVQAPIGRRSRRHHGPSAL